MIRLVGQTDFVEYGPFLWLNISGQVEVITHNRGRIPDEIKVFWDDGSGYKLHPDSDRDGTPYTGWRNVANTPNTTSIQFWSQQYGAGGGPPGEPTKVRLYWLGTGSI
jgi:hypothetical protein